MSATFDPKNPRVRLAQRKKSLNRPSVIVLNVFIIISLLLAGIALLMMPNPIGWLFISFTAWFFMFIYWIKNALKYIPVKDTDNFTDLLSEDLLLLIKPDMSSADLVKILSKSPGALFIMARFGMANSLFDYIAPFLPESTEPIYKAALDLRTKTNSAEITGAVLVVAILQSFPKHEKLLNQLKLSLDDLYQGIEWYNHLHGIVQGDKKPFRPGGIGRDFAFGFTPTLQRFATNLSERHSSFAHQIQQAHNSEVISQMVHTFTHGGRQNVALIGSFGSGRSTLVESFAAKLISADSDIPSSLRYHQVYSLSAPSLISAAKDDSELQYIMINIFNEIYSAKNTILCLDDAHLFFEEGPGSVDISNLLVPILEAGRVRLILVMDSQRFLEISAKNPALANALNKINVQPTNRTETMRILMDQVPYFEYQKKVIYTYQSLTTAYRLSKRYIHDVEMPGKAKLLLESAADYADHGAVTDISVETAIEQSYGVKVKVATDTDDRDKLLNLEQLIHENMIDQKEAVSAVANALRRAGAGVKNQGRPIGTFLFLGPTGVGKTELAKSLARAYFGGEDNIIRLDMNEFVSASDVSRLIRDGASDELSLTAQVMKKPFSVILLDEIEKAHSSVLTTLLQVLDEGILRDENNREVSFRDSIIIATSNAGANEIRQQVSDGTPIDTIKESLLEELISKNEFKPEFLNRFDEICLFKPLSKEDLLQILDLIIASVNRTLEPQKISVNVTPEAKQILIERGYDPKMGARPMRRIVQKTIENLVATAILSGAATPGTVLDITPEAISQ